MDAISSARNIRYGFYDPKPFTPPDASHVSPFVTIAARPVGTGADLREFVRAGVPVLPGFATLAKMFDPARIRLVSSEIGVQVGQSNDGASFLLYPTGHPPVQHFTELIDGLAHFVPPPEGVHLPAIARYADEPSTAASLLARYCWKAALRKTFLFQTAYEVTVAQIQNALRPRATSILNITDLALFRILRQNGLANLATAMPTFLLPQDRYSITLLVTSMVGRLMASGQAVHDPWMPPEAEPPPPPPENHLDADMNATLRFNSGLYARTPRTPLSPESVTRLQAQWQQAVTTNSDLHIVKELLHTIAPELAATLWTPITQGIALLSVETDLADIVTPRVSLQRFLGLATTADDLMYFLVRKGERIKTVTPALAAALARFSVPREFYPPLGSFEEVLATRNKDLVLRYLLGEHKRGETWGQGPLFEVLYQAGAAGLPVDDLNPGNLERERILRECGLEVLCGQWWQLASKEGMETTYRQYQAAASRLLA